MKQLVQYIHEKLHINKYKAPSTSYLFDKYKDDMIKSVKNLGYSLGQNLKDVEDYVDGSKEITKEFYEDNLKDIQKIINNPNFGTSEIKKILNKFINDLINNTCNDQDREDFDLLILQGMASDDVI